MSKETLQHLNTNTLIGNTDARGTAWHYRAEHQGERVQPLPGTRSRSPTWSAGCSTGRPCPGRSPSRCPPTSPP